MRVGYSQTKLSNSIALARAVTDVDAGLVYAIVCLQSIGSQSLVGDAPDVLLFVRVLNRNALGPVSSGWSLSSEILTFSMRSIGSLGNSSRSCNTVRSYARALQGSNSGEHP